MSQGNNRSFEKDMMFWDAFDEEIYQLSQELYDWCTESPDRFELFGKLRYSDFVNLAMLFSNTNLLNNENKSVNYETEYDYSSE